MKFLDNLKNSDGKKKTKKKIKLAAGMLSVFTYLIPIILIAIIVSTFTSWIVEITTSKNTADKVYEKLDVQDVSDLIQIKGDEANGYYLDFVDDIDEKLKNTKDYLSSKAGVKTITDTEFIKKMIKAEIITQYPDLGGNINSDSGFQGAIDIVRITPNKDIGVLKNTGAGEVTVVNSDTKSEMVNKDDINNQENTIKEWQKEKELKVVSKASVYEQTDSQLNPGEKIDYWTKKIKEGTQQYENFEKDDIVSYTGNYSISVNKLTNEGIIYIEVKKDDITGYVKYSDITSDLNSDKSDIDGTSSEEFEDSGYIEQDKEKIVEACNSKTFKLTYIPKTKFDEYIETNNWIALLYYSFDDSGRLVTASWNVGEDGAMKLTSNSSINLKTSLQNLVMPWTYLLYFYIDSDYKDFSSELADKVLDSKIVVALEDSVSTTYVNSVTEERKESKKEKFAYGWKEVSNTKNTTESCSTKVEVIYADTWCVKLSKESIYNDEISNIKNGEIKQLNMPGKVTESSSIEYTDPIVTETGADEEKEFEEVKDDKGNTVYVTDSNGISKPQIKEVIKKYKYSKYQKTTTNTTIISNTYDSGESKKTAKELVFVDLFKKHKMNNRIRDKWLLQILERDDRTANLVNLTKYLMYCATGENYGVLEYSFSEFDLSNFNTVSGIYGNSIEEKVWFALRGAGYSEYAVAGAMGNIYGESGFVPTAVEGGYDENSGGIGLCQWTNYPRSSGSGRNQSLKNYAASKGKTWKEEDVQIEFLIGELTKGGGADGYASYQLKSYNGSSESKWANATSVEDATEAFMWSFERPSRTAANKSLPKRTAKALEYYNEFQGREAPTGGEFYNLAYQLHEYLRINQYWYPSSANMNAGRYVSDGASVTHKIPVVGEPENQRYVDCSAYVSWVITKYTGRTQLYTAAGILSNKMGFDQVSLDELQPGDILVSSSHTEIYAGDGKTFNCGATKAIRSENSKYSASSFTAAFRAPSK